ncbi:MAG: histidine phosphatase family protein [Desulfobacterales bacterium]|nr:histidine phosphatase family protein [Desulfobacterales bacterium]
MDNRKITRFGLVRHAETVWNREKRIQGQSDSALTDRGSEDADNWGRRLSRFSWDRILMSDSGRAVETAETINHHLQAPAESDPRLREQDWGRWTGRRITQVETEVSSRLQEKQMRGWKFCPPGGEDRLGVWHRSHSALAEAANRWCGDTILIVTHEGVIKSLIYRLSGRQFLPDEPALIKSYNLHWLIFRNNVLRIEAINALALK